MSEDPDIKLFKDLADKALQTFRGIIKDAFVEPKSTEPKPAAEPKKQSDHWESDLAELKQSPTISPVAVHVTEELMKSIYLQGAGATCKGGIEIMFCGGDMGLEIDSEGRICGFFFHKDAAKRWADEKDRQASGN